MGHGILVIRYHHFLKSKITQDSLEQSANLQVKNILDCQKVSAIISNCPFIAAIPQDHQKDIYVISVVSIIPPY